MPPASPPRSLADGALELTEHLGTGAQGQVWRARDRVRDTEVAVKLVHASQDHRRFAGEIAALTRIHHRCLVRVHQTGAEQDFRWFSMDLHREGTVQDLIGRKGPMATPDALRITFDLLTGLAALHARAIVHRDVKPENLFVADDGRAVLGDLGIAHLTGMVDYRTATGASLGSMDYAAPEQLVDAKQVDARADLYGAGATLYHLVTAARPAYLFAPDDFPEVIAAAPIEVQPLILRACAHEPSSRYASASDMGHAVVEAHTACTGTPSAEAWLGRLKVPWWVRVGHWFRSR